MNFGLGRTSLACAVGLASAVWAATVREGAAEVVMFAAAPAAAPAESSGPTDSGGNETRVMSSEIANRPRLELGAGDFFAGELAPSDVPGKLAWQADALTDPLLFPLAAVAAVQYPLAADAQRADGEFCVELRDGDVLFGSVRALTSEALILETAQFGTLRIDRSELRQIERQGALDRIVYLGPGGLQGWTAGDATASWQSRGGRLETYDPGSIALQSQPTPQRCTIEVELSWRDQADFSFSMLSGEDQIAALAKALPRLLNRRQQRPEAQEPWQPAAAFELRTANDKFVLLTEGAEQADLAVIGTIEEQRNRLQLQLYIDPTARTVTAFSLDGRQIAQVQCPADALPRMGGLLTITNRNGNVRLDRLVIRESSSGPPTDVPADGVFVQNTEGQPQQADDLVIEASDVEAPSATAANFAQPLPLSAIARIVFPRRIDETAGDEGKDDRADKDPPGDPGARFDVRVATQSGLRLHGRLLAVVGNEVRLIRPGIAEPLAVAIDDVQSLATLGEGFGATHSLVPVGRLVGPGIECRGALVETTAQAGTEWTGRLVWQPLRSETASPIVTDLTGRIFFRSTGTPATSAATRPRRPPAEDPGVVIRALRAFSRIGANANRQVAAGDADHQLLWLKTGDCIPCRVRSIDLDGVRFESPAVEADFIPHELVKAWDRLPRSPAATMDERRRTRLLTLPRIQRNNPPLHLVESPDGDFLRGRLTALSDETLDIEVRLESRRIPAAKIARIIWLERPADVNDGDAPAATPEPTAEQLAGGVQVQAVRSDGVRLTFRVDDFRDGVLAGAREALGACTVEVKSVDELLLGDAITAAAEKSAYGGWQLHDAPDPRYLADEGGDDAVAGRESGLVGQVAPDFRLELLDGGSFQLKSMRGKVVVLEFWATWCGFCMQAMPRVEQVVESYDGERVVQVTVNLRENKETIAPVLERLGLKPRVALDIDGAAAEKFEVTGLPQTVVIGADGKVANVLTGNSLGLEDDLRAAIDAALVAAEANAASDGAGQ